MKKTQDQPVVIATGSKITYSLAKFDGRSDAALEKTSPKP